MRGFRAIINNIARRSSRFVENLTGPKKNSSTAPKKPTSRFIPAAHERIYRIKAPFFPRKPPAAACPKNFPCALIRPGKFFSRSFLVPVAGIAILSRTLSPRPVHFFLKPSPTSFLRIWSCSDTAYCLSEARRSTSFQSTLTFPERHAASKARAHSSDSLFGRG